MRIAPPQLIVGASLGLALVISSTGPAPVFADSPADDALELVAAATPATVDAAASVRTDTSGDVAIKATLAGVDFTVPVEAKEGILINGDAETIEILLPFADAADDAIAEKQGIVSYDNNNGSVTVPIVQTDGSIQINTVIADASAPSRYTYELVADAPHILHLVEDGSVYLADVHGRPALYVAAPGRRMPTDPPFRPAMKSTARRSRRWSTSPNAPSSPSSPILGSVSTWSTTQRGAVIPLWSTRPGTPGRGAHRPWRDSRCGTRSSSAHHPRIPGACTTSSSATGTSCASGCRTR